MRFHKIVFGIASPFASGLPRLFRPWPVLAMLFASAFCLDANADCFPAPPNLVGWWPGDGSATNIAGTNQGTLQGGATANTPGIVGTAFNFDGTNGFVQITNGPLLQPTNLTIEAWVRFKSLDSAGSGGSPPGDQYIVFKQNSRSGNFEGFDLSKMRVGGVDVFRFMVASAAGLEIEILSATTVSTGAWYHVAATRGSNFIQLYVNGVLERQTNVAFPQDFGNFPLYFGSSGQSYWDHKLNGSLDEVSLYNRALTSNEIGAIYATGAAGKCKAPNLITQPQNVTVAIGRNVTFSAAATGYGPLGYLWRQNGTAIPGATTTSLTLTNVQPVAAGSYSVLVANALGSVTSSNAILTVIRPGALLDVDFDGGTNTSEIGPAAIGQNSNDFWNLYQGAGGFRSQGGFEALTTADGTSTPVAINLPNAPGSWGNGSSDPMYNGYVYPTYQASSTPMFINVTNLPPGSYDFYLYASDGNFEIVVDALDYGIRTSLDNPLTNPPVWMEGTQFVLFRDVAITNSAQSVLITVRPGIYGYAIISGLQIARYTPLILLQPANAAVITGSNIVLQVTGDSVPAPGYQWFFNGNPVSNGGRTAGATSGTLTISNAQPADAGGYFAVLTGTGGSATSSVATVLVGLPPGIVQSPTGQNKAVGDSVQLTVTASGTAPLGYQWLLNGAPLSDDARHAGSTTTTLAITNLVLGDAGNYAAAVSNAFGTVTSAVAVLTVSVPPGFNQQPQSQTNSAGNLVSLAANVSGTLPIIYQWFFNGTPLANNGRIIWVDSNSLSILSAVTNDTGNYWLVASNLIGVATSAVATLTINPAVCSSTVTGLVSWWTGDGNAFDSAGINDGLLVGNASYGPGFVGQAFVLDGSGDGVSVGNPANLQLQDFTIEAWIKRADPAIATHGSHTTALIFSYGSLGYGFGLWNDGRLFLTRVDIDNVTISAGITDTNFHHVAVTKSGSTVVFYIDGTAFPAPAYSTPFSFGTSAAIGMRADTVNDSFLGSIDEVSVYNRPLAVSEIQTIYYSSSMGKCPLPPLFAQSPQSALVAVGSNTVLSAAVTGSQPLAFQWLFNNNPLSDGAGITGSTTPSLSFTNIQTNASGAYLLVASNSVGSVTSAVANLTVFIPPSFVIQPTNQSWIIGSNGTLVALATGTEPISYQWQHAGTNLTDNGRISGTTTGSLT
ncbi:MAG TPA: immunoglobulin domain-containing protein, partial [Verrucomicrobiae bacterium]|nr:immunoglobulin domain-containing protein [Verrucomicrobiae bacterium]